MFFNQPRPFFYLGKIPVTVVGIIILAQLVGMISWALYSGTTGSSLLDLTSFTPQQFVSGEIWRLVSYPIFSRVGVMALLGLFFFYQFGIVVETALERRQFILLCLSILLVGPITLILFYLLGVSQRDFPLFGSNILSLAMFCMYCVMNPNAPFFILKIPMKWVALVFFCGTVLSLCAAGAWGMASSYFLGTALAVWMIQSRGLALVNVFPPSMMIAPKKKKKKKVVKFKQNQAPLPPSKLRPQVDVPEDTEIDKILDKISAEGIHSLSSEERATLEAASKK